MSSSKKNPPANPLVVQQIYQLDAIMMAVWLNHKIVKNDEQRTMNISLGDKECH